jgi:hypothetical protein
MTRLGELVALLDEQIDSAENGRFECVENLMASSSALAREIAEAGAIDPQARQLWKGQIVHRYKRLELILASAREITKGELKHVQTTKKMLAVYRGSNR